MRTLLTAMAVLLLSSTLTNAQKNKTPDTQIIQDQNTGQVIIKIEGQTIGIFDKGGLTVKGNIKYEGAMIDIDHAKNNAIIPNSGSNVDEGG